MPRNSSKTQAQADAIARLNPVGKKPRAAKSKPEARAQKERDPTYVRSLQMNRDYEGVMRAHQSGAAVDPPLAVKSEDLFAKDQEAAERRKQDKERLKKAIEKPPAQTEKLPRKDKVWCAHCNFRHAEDFHRQQQRAPKRAPFLRRSDFFGLPRKEESTDSEMDDFIVPDEGPHLEAVSREIRKLFRYNPKHRGDREVHDRSMEASYDEIIREEKRSAHIGDREDALELKKQRKRRKV